MARTLLETLTSEHEETLEQWEELLTRDERNEEEDEKANQLQEKASKLNKRIGEERNRMDAFEKHKALKGKSRYSAPTGNQLSDEQKRQGGFKRSMIDVFGMKEDGLTRLGYDMTERDFKILSQTGAGTIGADKWDTICTQEYYDGFCNYLRGGKAGVEDRDQKLALEAGVDKAGGQFVPPEVLNELIMRKPAPTRLAALVRRITASRDKIEIPKVGYVDSNNIATSPVSFKWVGEKPKRNKDLKIPDNMEFGDLTIPVQTAMGTLKISRTLLEDEAFDVLGFFLGEIRLAYEQLVDNMILNGDGVAQPLGILEYTAGVGDWDIPTQNVGNPPTVDGLMDLVYGLEEQYDNNQVMVMRKTSTFREIAKLKTGVNSNMLALGYGVDDSGLRSRRVPEFQGYPIIYSAWMPALTSAAKAILLGDFSGYMLVNRIGLSIQTLKEMGAKEDKDELVVRFRFGGGPTHPHQFKIGIAS